MDNDSVGKAHNPNLIIREGKNSFEKFEVVQQIHLSPSKDESAGQLGEKMLHEFFAMVLGPDSIFDTGYVYLKGEERGKETTRKVEVSDGAVIYEDSLFLLQIKTREPSISDDAESLEKWISKMTKKAAQQSRETISFLEQFPTLEVKNYLEEPRTLRTKNYNLISLLILVFPDISIVENIPPQKLIRNNIKEQLQGVPLLRTSANELINIYAMSQTPLVVEYLRMMQYQDDHMLNNDIVRYLEIFSYEENFLLYEFNKEIYNLVHQKKINKHASKRLTSGLDYLYSSEKQAINEHFDNDRDRIYAFAVKETNTTYCLISLHAKEKSHTINTAVDAAKEELRTRRSQNPKLEEMANFLLLIQYTTLDNQVFYVLIPELTKDINRIYIPEKELPSLSRLLNKIQ